jgi:hypothetical protein
MAEGLAGPSRAREYRDYVETHRSIAAFWETIQRDLALVARAPTD